MMLTSFFVLDLEIGTIKKGDRDSLVFTVPISLVDGGPVGPWVV